MKGQASLLQDVESGIELAEGLFLLRGLADTKALGADIESVISRAALRRMYVPRGGKMSVAMTNCGALGWVSDTRGYRYSAHDPLSGQAWPEIPPSFLALAKAASKAAGYGDFEPDACLVNHYTAGTSLSLHQDRNEASFDYPIVSVSIGSSAQFLWGGLRRQDPVKKMLLHDGDVLVWGGAVRLAFHGVAVFPRREKEASRFNLTLRKAG